jgi:outer membrane protein assembly factor BamB
MVLLVAMACTLAAQDAPKPADPKTSKELPPGVRWSIDLFAPPAGPPFITGNRVFVPALPGLVAMYDLSDGRELWRAVLNPDQPLDADGQRLYIATGESVQGFNATDQSVAWRTPTGTITAPLLVKDGWIIAASATKLFALRASDGAIIWSQDSGPQEHRAAISGDLLFVPLTSGMIRAHDLTSGKVRWERRIAGSPAEPLILGDRLYAGATDKKFYCIRTKDGEPDWDRFVGAVVRAKAATDGVRVFYVGFDNLVRAIRHDNGSLLWQEPVKFRPFEGPWVIGPTVVVTGRSTEFVQMNTLSGRDVGKIVFPEPLSLAPAFGTLGDAAVLAGITGGLTEAWKLWLATPEIAPAKK